MPGADGPGVATVSVGAGRIGQQAETERSGAAAAERADVGIVSRHVDQHRCPQPAGAGPADTGFVIVVAREIDHDLRLERNAFAPDIAIVAAGIDDGVELVHAIAVRPRPADHHIAAVDFHVVEDFAFDHRRQRRGNPATRRSGRIRRMRRGRYQAIERIEQRGKIDLHARLHRANAAQCVGLVDQGPLRGGFLEQIAQVAGQFLARPGGGKGIAHAPVRGGNRCRELRERRRGAVVRRSSLYRIAVERQGFTKQRHDAIARVRRLHLRNQAALPADQRAGIGQRLAVQGQAVEAFFLARNIVEHALQAFARRRQAGRGGGNPGLDLVEPDRLRSLRPVNVGNARGIGRRATPTASSRR